MPKMPNENFLKTTLYQMRFAHLYVLSKSSKVWTHLEKELTNYQNKYEMMPLITLVYGITLFLIKKSIATFMKEFIEPF